MLNSLQKRIIATLFFVLAAVLVLSLVLFGLDALLFVLGSLVVVLFTSSLIVILLRRRKQRREKVISTEVPTEPDFSRKYQTGYRYGDDSFEKTFKVKSDGKTIGVWGLRIAEVLRHDSDFRMPIAFEVWLADIRDPKPSSAVVVSPWTYGRKRLMEKISAIGTVESASALDGSELILETLSLRLEMQLTKVQYGEGAVPAKSFFTKVDFEVKVEPSEQNTAEA